MAIRSLYLSRVQGNKIHTQDGKVLGTLKDLGAVIETKNPVVSAVKVKTSDGIKYYGWNGFEIVKDNGQYVITCMNVKEITVPDNVVFLGRHILDKQIIDVNGRKVVRVNDVRLALLTQGVVVVAVDIGAEGLLRRIGLAKPVKKMLKTFDVKLPSKLILWDDVETIFRSSESIKLSKTYNKLSTLHPSDLADIIEDFDTKTGMAIFSSLDIARAADVLEEMESDAQVSILKTLSTDRAADILEEMPADEVADILDELREHEAEKLLNSMERDASTEVRELMEYEDDEVGSLMATDFISFKVSDTVQKTIETLRAVKPEEDSMYYLYVVDEDGKLNGVVSLRNLVISNPDTVLESIMNEDYISVYDMDSVDSLIKTVSKYNLLAIPVVGKDMELLGTVIINDIIYELIKHKRKGA
jgi:magnesium transporter